MATKHRSPHKSHLKDQIQSLDSGGKILATDFDRLGLPPFEQKSRPPAYTLELKMETPRDVYLCLERLPVENQEYMMDIITRSLVIEKSVLSKWYPPLVEEFSSSTPDYYWEEIE